MAFSINSLGRVLINSLLAFLVFGIYNVSASPMKSPDRDAPEPPWATVEGDGIDPASFPGRVACQVQKHQNGAITTVFWYHDALVNGYADYPKNKIVCDSELKACWATDVVMSRNTDDLRVDIYVKYQDIQFNGKPHRTFTYDHTSSRTYPLNDSGELTYVLCT